MSYNGSGTFNINSTGLPVVTATTISATMFNALTADLGTGLSTAICKDGQTACTARIPFAFGVSSTLDTNATSVTTGSIITAGGISCVKAIWVGGLANIAGVATLQDDVKVTATKKLYLDGGGNTYLHEVSADVMAIVTGGSERARVNSTGQMFLGGTTTDASVSTIPYYCAIGSPSGFFAATAAADASTVSLGIVAATNVSLNCGLTGGGAYLKFQIATSSAYRFTVNTNGTIAFNAYTAGTLTTDGSGNITATSDMQMKEDIRPFTAGLREVMELRPALYRWKESTGFDATRDYAGFVAQNVQKAIPIAVMANPNDGMLSIQDRPILAAMVSAIQELSHRLEVLES